MDALPGGIPPVSSARGETAPGAALLCALACVVFLRTGFLSIFFLVPLGFAAVGFTAKTAWFAAVGAAGGNGFLSLVFSLMGLQGGGMGEVVFFTLITVLFTAAVAPPGDRFSRIPGAYRLLGGAAASALAFWLLVVLAPDNGGFYTYLRSQAELLSSLYVDSTGADVVRRSLTERYFSPDAVMEIFRFLVLRGGGLVSAALIFLLNRQIGRGLARIFLRRGEDVPQFHVSPRFIWVLSGSLLLILLSRFFKIDAPAPVDIVLWNILTLCAMLYLAQGWGILMFLLSRAAMPPFLRFAINVVLIFLIFRPGVNALILGLMVLLGIAENWVPLRAPKNNGPPSTPGV